MNMQTSFSILILASCIYYTEAWVSPISVKINGSYETATPIVTITEKPKCDLQNRTGICCLTVSVPAKDEHVESCVKVELDNRHRPYASLLIQDHTLFKSEIKAGEVCYPIHGTSLTACLNIYYLNMDPELDSADACFFVSISKLVYLDFKCIKYANRKLEHTQQIPKAFLQPRRNLTRSPFEENK